ncbi:hypothetical protein D6779_04655, partial [Candidatus Parcubacteria bacterium]
MFSKLIRHKQQLVDWFMPDSLDPEQFPVQYRRSRMMIELHLYLLLFMFIMLVLTWTVVPENGEVPLWWGVFFLISSLLILKLTQSLEITGNFIAAGWFLVLVPAILKTGGLYSDNMLWLALAPAIA